MKVYTKDGVVFAEAETIEDIAKLIALRTPAKTKTTAGATIVRKAYKRQYTKVCGLCGKKVKGVTGLRTHERFMHSNDGIVLKERAATPAESAGLFTNDHPSLSALVD